MALVAIGLYYKPLGFMMAIIVPTVWASLHGDLGTVFLSIGAWC